MPGAVNKGEIEGRDDLLPVFAISSSACFCPEDDDPENFDGRMVTWTFAAPKDTRTGAGIYRLEFVRILTPEERGNTDAQLGALASLASPPKQPTDALTLDGMPAVHPYAVVRYKRDGDAWRVTSVEQTEFDPEQPTDERTGCVECNGTGVAEYMEHWARPCDACHGHGTLAQPIGPTDEQGDAVDQVISILAQCYDGPISYDETVATQIIAALAQTSAPSPAVEDVGRLVRIGRDPTIAVMASLAAAISLLERGGKKAAASDKMFEQMLDDYRKALGNAREAFATQAATPNIAGLRDALERIAAPMPGQAISVTKRQEIARTALATWRRG